MLEAIKEAADYIRSKVLYLPSAAIVLGSGLGGLINDMEVEWEIPYADIPHFPISTVQGHQGKLVVGLFGGWKRIMVMQGRFHYYEGYSMKEVTFPIRVMQQLGIHLLFLSNAAGGLNPDFKTGDLMLIKDHINHFPENPLRGKNDEALGVRFPDMSNVYDEVLRDLVKKIALDKQYDLKEGVYLGTSGPSFETPSECRFFRTIGADAVGMSTVPEAIVATHAKMRVVAFSVITNMNISEHFQATSHEEVQEVAQTAEPILKDLIKELLIRL